MRKPTTNTNHIWHSHRAAHVASRRTHSSFLRLRRLSVSVVSASVLLLTASSGWAESSCDRVQSAAVRAGHSSRFRSSSISPDEEREREGEGEKKKIRKLAVHRCSSVIFSLLTVLTSADICVMHASFTSSLWMAQSEGRWKWVWISIALILKHCMV